MQFAISPMLAQAIPQQSQLVWLLNSLDSISGLLVLITAAAIFAGACYLVRSQQPVAAMAAYLIFLPLPCIINLCGWIKGTIASLSVIAIAPNLQLTNADIAAGLAASLFGLFVAILVSAPTYAVLAYGLLSRTMRTTSTMKPHTAGDTSPATPHGGLPIVAPQA